MWKRIRESLPFLLVGLILFVFGGLNFVKLAIIPHINKFTEKL